MIRCINSITRISRIKHRQAILRWVWYNKQGKFKIWIYKTKWRLCLKSNGMDTCLSFIHETCWNFRYTYQCKESKHTWRFCRCFGLERYFLDYEEIFLPVFHYWLDVCYYAVILRDKKKKSRLLQYPFEDRCFWIYLRILPIAKILPNYFTKKKVLEFQCLF